MTVRTKEHGFIPHRQCTLSSGNCFYASECLDNCRSREKVDHETRIRSLEKQVVALELRIIALERK